MGERPAQFSDADAIADAIVAAVGKRIVIGLPLGLGKANAIVNALVERGVRDSSIRLEIFTALTLERPTPSNEWERRFWGPALDRLFGDYPGLSYTRLLRESRLPENIRVSEFYLSPGQWLGNAHAQREYVSANYTHVLNLVAERGVNVVAQLVPDRTREGLREFSLSCNPDITFDLLKARREGAVDFVFAVEINDQLPFMVGDALIDGRDVDMVLERAGGGFELFSMPRPPITLADQAIGLHAARLVPDGGTLQIGIGSVGDAVAQGLIVRHTKNDRFQELTRALAPTNKEHLFHDDTFDTGLYGLSEMFVEGFVHLARHGVLKRAVDGAILHGGFFVETRDFYRELREMAEEERARFQMKPISFINELYGGEDARRAARQHARFINQGMIATLLGAIVSDAREDGQVVSGVGGQYNFVAQAFALHGARSVVAVNTTRKSKGKTVSNIRWAYGHQTIPRHLRDIVVTEYGVADLRGKSDEDVIAEMLSIADSRFQEELADTAKQNGKLRNDYTIPPAFRENRPERLREILGPARKAGDLPAFPFGTDFTETEQGLLPALNVLKHAAHSKPTMLRLLLRGLTAGTPSKPTHAYLQRMRLDEPSSIREYVYAKLLRAALLETDED